MVYFMCKFHRTATSSSSAGSTTWTFEPLTMPKISLAVVPNYALSLTSPRCYGSTLSPGLPTLLVRRRESWWACWLDPCCPFPPQVYSHFFFRMTTLSTVFGERLRWRGRGSPQHEGGGEKTEWMRERKAREGRRRREDWAEGAGGNFANLWHINY